MKKNYLTPSVSVIRIEARHIIAFSDPVGSNNGLGYGGIDKDGILDPSIKKYRVDIWEEEW